MSPLKPTTSIGVYQLQATYKPGAKVHPLLDKAADSSVDHIVLTVDKQTYDPVRATWVYRNGSTIVMNITMAAVQSFRLPQRETVDMNLPSHRVSALITFGTYQTNISIPDSTFSAS